jgi:hypothetical protein
MSTCGPNLVTRGRWIGWRSTPRKSANSLKGEPTKPSKPGFVGFVGAPLARFVNISTPIGLRKSRAVWPHDASAHGIQFDLDSATKGTRLMSCGATSGRGRSGWHGITGERMNQIINSDGAWAARA